VLARSSISDKLLIQSICRKTNGRQMIMMIYRKNRSKPGKGSETREGANAPIVWAGFDELINS
jgi:hypothetical protein